MPFKNVNTVNISQSALYDIHGDYNSNMAPEGKQGIDRLFDASCPAAFHDSRARFPPPRCHSGTRLGVLNEITNWIYEGTENILWLYGPAGAGKSAIAQELAEECADNSILAASFFFYHGDTGRNTPERLVASIAYQLAVRTQRWRQQIGTIVEEDPSILHKPIQTQVHTLILPLFLSVSPDIDNTESQPVRPPEPFLVILDGLDECQGDSNQREVMKCIIELAFTVGVPLRFLIFSRPEPVIEELLLHLPFIYRASLSNPIHLEEAKNDIYRYLRDGFDEIYDRRTIITEEFWPEYSIISQLVDKSGGAFIYASTVLKYVDDDDYNPVERLKEVLDTPPGLAPFAELDYIYYRVLTMCPSTQLLIHILKLVFTREVHPLEWYINSVPLCIVNDFYRFHVHEVELLLELQAGTVMMVLRRLRSIIDIGESGEIEFSHKSFEDFIHDEERAGDFFIDIKEGNAFMTKELLRFVRDPSRNSVHESAIYLQIVAQTYWWIYCLESGTSGEHPYLVEEISKTLECYPLSMGDIYVVSFHICQWLEGIQTELIHLQHIQYTIFRKVWGQLLESFRGDCIHASTIVVLNPAEGCKNNACQTGGSSILFSSHGCFSLENLACGHLFRRLVRESGNLEYYNMRIVYGYAEATVWYLDLRRSETLRPRIGSEMRRDLWWPETLKDVEYGDKEVLSALKRFDRSMVRSFMTMEEIQDARTWLKASGVVPYGAWRKKHDIGRRELLHNYEFPKARKNLKKELDFR